MPDDVEAVDVGDVDLRCLVRLARVRAAADDVAFAVACVDHVAAALAVQLVPPGSADQDVVVDAAVDRVVAGAAVEFVRPESAAEDVVAGAAVELVADVRGAARDQRVIAAEPVDDLVQAVAGRQPVGTVRSLDVAVVRDPPRFPRADRPHVDPSPVAAVPPRGVCEPAPVWGKREIPTRIAEIALRTTAHVDA